MATYSGLNTMWRFIWPQAFIHVTTVISFPFSAKVKGAGLFFLFEDITLHSVCCTTVISVSSLLYSQCGEESFFFISVSNVFKKTVGAFWIELFCPFGGQALRFRSKTFRDVSCRINGTFVFPKRMLQAVRSYKLENHEFFITACESKIPFQYNILQSSFS